MLEASFPSFTSKTPSEIPMFRTFLAKNSILAYISLKIAKLGKIGNYDVIATPYTRYLYFFDMYGKRRHIATLWYQISESGIYLSSS